MAGLEQGEPAATTPDGRTSARRRAGGSPAHVDKVRGEVQHNIQEQRPLWLPRGAGTTVQPAANQPCGVNNTGWKLITEPQNNARLRRVHDFFFF